MPVMGLSGECAPAAASAASQAVKTAGSAMEFVTKLGPPAALKTNPPLSAAPLPAPPLQFWAAW